MNTQKIQNTGSEENFRGDSVIAFIATLSYEDAIKGFHKISPTNPLRDILWSEIQKKFPNRFASIKGILEGSSKGAEGILSTSGRQKIEMFVSGNGYVSLKEGLEVLKKRERR